MTCPSARLNSEDTWPGPYDGPQDFDLPDLVTPSFPRDPKGRERPIPDDLVPPDPPRWGDGRNKVVEEDPEGTEDDDPDGGNPSPYEEPREMPEGPEAPHLETPDGIDLEQFDEGFEDSDDFFHEDYETDGDFDFDFETPDDEQQKLRLQTQEQEAGQNARLLNTWFKNIGQGLILGQLPGLNRNTGSLLPGAQRRMLETLLAREYALAENWYASLYSTVFVKQRTGESGAASESFTPKVRSTSPGGFSDSDLRTVAGAAITAIGLAASYGLIYRGRLGISGITAQGGILGLEQY